jgi:hypothetical protein
VDWETSHVVYLSLDATYSLFLEFIKEPTMLPTRDQRWLPFSQKCDIYYGMCHRHKFPLCYGPPIQSYGIEIWFAGRSLPKPNHCGFGSVGGLDSRIGFAPGKNYCQECITAIEVVIKDLGYPETRDRRALNDYCAEHKPPMRAGPELFRVHYPVSEIINFWEGDIGRKGYKPGGNNCPECIKRDALFWGGKYWTWNPDNIPKDPREKSDKT